MRHRLTLFVVTIVVLLAGMPVGPAAGGDVRLQILDDAAELGFRDDQLDIIGRHAWDIRGETQSYGFADDPLGEPGLGEADTVGLDPQFIGFEYVRFTDRSLLPEQFDGPTRVGDDFFVPFGMGGIEIDTDYLWFWAEFDEEVPFDNPRLGLNFAFPFYVSDQARYENESFPGDSWAHASDVVYMYSDSSGTDDGSLEWFAGLFTGDDFFLEDDAIPGGLGWICGRNIGFLVPASVVKDAPGQHVEEYGISLDVTLDAQFRFDPDADRRVTVYPGNFGADGRTGGLQPVTMPRSTLHIGYSPLVDAIGARVFYNDDMRLWANLEFARPWPTMNTTAQLINDFFSIGLQWGVGFDSTTGPFLGSDWHDGEHSLFGSGPDGEITPMGMYVLDDGSLNVDLGVELSDVGDNDPLTVYLGSAFWVDEATTERQSATYEFEIPVAEIEQEDPTGDGSTTYATFDIVDNAKLAPPSWATTTTSTSTTSTTVADTTTVAAGDAGDEESGGGFPFILILVIALIAFLIWWFLLRPQPGTGETGTGGGTTTSGGRTRERGSTPPISSVPPDDHQHVGCGWGVFFDDGARLIPIREPGPDQHLCCKYVVKVVTSVIDHAQARRTRQDDGADRLHLADLDYAWQWVDFSGRVSTRSGPAGRLDWMQGLGDPSDQSDLPVDPYWQDGPEAPEVASSLRHRERTDVDIRLEAGCPEYENVYSVSAKSALELMATQECTNDAGDPCPVELNAFGFFGGWITGPGNIFCGASDWTGTDPDELERSPRAEERMRGGNRPHTPGDSHDHVERDRITYEVSRSDQASDALERDDLSVAIENDIEIDAGQIVPDEVWPTTERVTAHLEGDLAHDLQITVKLKTIDCDTNNCGDHGVCACDATWTMQVSGAGGSWIDAGEGPFEIYRDPSAADPRAPFTGDNPWVGKS